MQPLEQSNSTSNVGVVLLNMGGPATLDDVRPFLYNLFADPDIIDLPWIMKPFQKQFAWLVAKFRTPGTTEMYEHIGNGSPILGITEGLADEIQVNLADRFDNVEATVAMRYTYPRAEHAIRELKEKDIDTLVLFSQYPHYADSTTGSSMKDFYEVMEDLEFNPSHIIEIDEWGTEPEYIDWWVKGIKEVISSNDVRLNKSTHLIFSAHGLPQRYVDKGETYPDRIKEAANLIMSELAEISSKITTHVSFQSQAGPVEWTRPYTDELLREIAEDEDQTVIVVPLGFVSNHVETLYEIDILYKDEVEELGLHKYYRVEVPDADPNYAKDMVDLILRRMEE